jgi:hypothetical protein
MATVKKQFRPKRGRKLASARYSRTDEASEQGETTMGESIVDDGSLQMNDPKKLREAAKALLELAEFKEKVNEISSICKDMTDKERSVFVCAIKESVALSENKMEACTLLFSSVEKAQIAYFELKSREPKRKSSSSQSF